MKIVYLFSGKAQAGKDYTSNQLKDALEKKGMKVLKLAFADTLKSYLSILLDISVEELEKMKVEEKPFTSNGLTIRQLMQRMGTELFRKQFGYDFWIEKTAKMIADTDYQYYIISDFRFPNEINVIDYACGYDEYNTYMFKTVRIVNDDLIKASNHISENLLDNVKHDIVIDNTGHRYQFNLDDFKI